MKILAFDTSNRALSLAVLETASLRHLPDARRLPDDAERHRPVDLPERGLHGSQLRIHREFRELSHRQ